MIYLTHTARFALHVASRVLLLEVMDELRQPDQILDTKVGPPVSSRDERVHLLDIRPARWEPPQMAVLVAEVDQRLPPGVATRLEAEAASAQRMEWMGHPENRARIALMSCS